MTGSFRDDPAAPPAAVSHVVDDPREKPLPQLLRDLSQELVHLFKQEVELAKAEVGAKGQQAKQGAVAGGLAGFVALLAGGALTAALILGLAEFMPAWVAALIVAAVLGGAAAVLAQRAKKEFQQAVPPVPEQTVETLKEDVEWARTQTPSGRTSSGPGRG